MILAFASLLFATASFAAEITPPTFGPTAYTVSAPVVASNGNGFLSLWTVDTQMAGRHVYGSLADSNGSVVTPTSFLVVPNATLESIFRNGSEYIALVNTNNGSGPLQVAHISSAGQLTRLGATLPTPPTRSFARAFNEKAFFTIGLTSQTFPPGRTFGQIVTIDGRVVRDNIAFAELAVFAVATAGDDFVVAFADTNGVFVQRFTFDGREVWTKRKIADASLGTIQRLSIASNGTDAALAWDSFRAGAPATTSVVRVDATGTIVSKTSFQIAAMAYPSLLWSGSKYVLVSNTGVIAILTNAGAISTPFPALSGVSVSGIAAAHDIAFLVGLSAPPPPAPYSPPRVIGAAIKLGDVLTASSAVVLSITLRRQGSPAIATDGFVFLAVWSDETADEARLAAMPLDRDGNPLRTLQVDVGALRRSYFYSSTRTFAVAFGSSVYLVVWQNGPDVVARRLDRFGNPLDIEPIVLQKQAAISDQAVAWNGSSFLVAFLSNGFSSRVMVGEDGTVSTSLKLFSTNSFAPDVAWDGSRFLLVVPLPSGCTVSACPPPLPIGMLLTRLNRRGEMADQQPLPAILWPSTTPYHLASNGREFAIAADTFTSSSNGFTASVEVRRIRADGPALTVSEPVAMFTWPQPLASTLTADGAEFVLVSRYGFGETQWVRVTRFASIDSVLPARFANVGMTDVNDPPAFARGLIVMSEIASRGGIARLYSHLESQTQPVPPPPPAPLITSATGTATSVTLTWLMAPVEVAGFIVERVNPFTGAAYSVARFPGEARSGTISLYPTNSPLDQYVRMRALNAGGVSEPTAAVRIMPPKKNRSVRH